ncbi:heat shock protein HtpX, partial [Klebsiella pneumoniae RYC492]
MNTVAQQAQQVGIAMPQVAIYHAPESHIVRYVSEHRHVQPLRLEASIMYSYGT